mmetsp:Transcript_1023/g.1943  ORF Transcript_1023/g.1943 Transcript_1023/m.1943 type:complete len:214 (+) Transcript_1023:1538-2179(+)
MYHTMIHRVIAIELNSRFLMNIIDGKDYVVDIHKTFNIFLHVMHVIKVLNHLYTHIQYQTQTILHTIPFQTHDIHAKEILMDTTESMHHCSVHILHFHHVFHDIRVVYSHSHLNSLDLQWNSSQESVHFHVSSHVVEDYPFDKTFDDRIHIHKVVLLYDILHVVVNSITDEMMFHIQEIYMHTAFLQYDVDTRTKHQQKSIRINVSVHGVIHG